MKVCGWYEMEAAGNRDVDLTKQPEERIADPLDNEALFLLVVGHLFRVVENVFGPWTAHVDVLLRGQLDCFSL